MTLFDRPMKTQGSREGICRLTKRRGKFVKAHLIPKALTKPAVAGFPFVENMHGGRPARKWSSWYDNKLVTAEGEAVLAALDNWAIPELRKHNLVWSGWGPMRLLPYGQDHDPIGDTGFGLRKVSGLDASRLRLFYLSLLWRAAASTHYGFAEIKLPSPELEKLGEMLLASDSGAPSYFSIHLTQISTLGPAQNLVPLARTKTIPAVGDVQEHYRPYYRFYFEGLVAHIHLDPEYESHKLGPFVLGQEESIAITTVTYEMSFQRKNLMNLMADANKNWPDLMAKL
jgi:hypothetical protein